MTGEPSHCHPEKFDETLWRTLLKHVVIYTKKDIRFVFRNGQEVQML